MHVNEILRHLRLPAVLVRIENGSCLRVIAYNQPMKHVFDFDDASFAGCDLSELIRFREPEAWSQITAPPRPELTWEGNAVTFEPNRHSTNVSVRVTSFPDDDTDHLRLVVLQEIEQQELTLALHRSRRQFQKLVDDSPDMNYVLDVEGKVVDMNRAGLEILGYSLDELRKGDYTFRLHPDDVSRVQGVFERVISGGVEQFETRLITRNDDELLVEVLASPYLFDDEIVGLYGIARDITEKRRVEDLLRESELRYRSLFDSNIDAVLTFDVAGNFVQLNRATTEMMGYTEDELLGKPFLPFIVPALQDHTMAEFARVLEGSTVRYETSVYSKFGEIVDLHITVIPIVIGGEIRGIHCIGKDITRQNDLSRELNRMAYFDPLTSLPNRNSLDEALEKFIGEDASFTLITLDLDRLRTVNARWGRAIGDALLKSTAKRLLGHLQGTAEVYRYNGDNIVLIARDACAGENLRLAASVHQMMQGPFEIGEIKIHSSAAIGVAEFPHDGRDPDTLLKHSEDAMIAAKGKSSHRIVRYRDLDRNDEDRHLQLELGLKAAIENNELSLVFQPQVDVKMNQIHGAEALLRWTHPEYGPISPMEFIPLAERTGDIHSIGLWVVARACEQLVLWNKLGAPIPGLSVNVSIDQFYNPDFADELEKIIRVSGVSPSQLVLEITESIASNADTVVSQLERFAGIGVRIAIDDFGTGYSSLRYLKDFPVDILKIDRSFVDQVAENPRDRDLTATITSLAGNFGLQTIAEGVETEAQLRVLRDLGVDHVQGYLYCKPLPADKLEDWLEISGQHLSLQN